MPPKCQPSTPNPSQMMELNPEGSKPSSSLNIAVLTSTIQSAESSKASLHQGSDKCLVGQGSFSNPNGENSEEEDSSLSLLAETDCHTDQPQKWSRNFNPDMDPKKLKRLLANRVSAQKSRMKKQEYVEKLKKEINTQQAKISGLAPQVAFYEVQKAVLEDENEAMKQRLEMLEKQKAEKDAEFRKLKHERDMLALTYFLQQEGI